MRAHVLLFLPLLFLGCERQPTSVDSGFLSGSFDWVRSAGGIAYHEITPSGAGYGVRLIFVGNSVRAYRDGRLVDQARFTVTEDSMRMGPMPVYIVRYDPPLAVFPFASFDEQTVRALRWPQILLEDGCCDRYAHTFTMFGVR